MPDSPSKSRHCAFCWRAFSSDRPDKKFCKDSCRVAYNVQAAINRVHEVSVTIAEASLVTGLSESTIRKRLRLMNLDTFKVGHGSIRIRRSDARRLLDFTGGSRSNKQGQSN